MNAAAMWFVSMKYVDSQTDRCTCPFQHALHKNQPLHTISLLAKMLQATYGSKETASSLISKITWLLYEPFRDYYADEPTNLTNE
jgi:hypothetical protein